MAAWEHLWRWHCCTRSFWATLSPHGTHHGTAYSLGIKGDWKSTGFLLLQAFYWWDTKTWGSLTKFCCVLMPFFKCYYFKPFSLCFQSEIVNKRRGLGNTNKGFNHNHTQIVLRLKKVWFLVCFYHCSFGVSWWTGSEHRCPIHCNTLEGWSTQKCPLLWNFQSSLVDPWDLNNCIL